MSVRCPNVEAPAASTIPETEAGNSDKEKQRGSQSALHDPYGFPSNRQAVGVHHLTDDFFVPGENPPNGSHHDKQDVLVGPDRLIAAGEDERSDTQQDRTSDCQSETPVKPDQTVRRRSFGQTAEKTYRCSGVQHIDELVEKRREKFEIPV